MQVNSYIYKSPSTLAVQVGRLDPSSKKDSASTTEGNFLGASTNESLQNAQNFTSSQQNEVKTSVKSANTLDVYA